MPITSKDLRETLDQLQNRAANGPVSGLYLILRDKTPEEIRYEILRARVEQPLMAAFRKTLGETIEALLQIEDVEIIEYDPAYLSDRVTVETLPIGQVNGCQEMTDRMIELEGANYVQGADPAAVRRLWAIAVRTTVGNRHFFYFRKFSSTKVLEAESGFSSVFRDGVFTRLSSPVFHFDGQVDCFTVGNEMVITNKPQFEKIFSYNDFYVDQAQQTLDVLEQSGLFSNMETLAAACMGDSRKARILWQVRQRQDLQNMDFDRLRTVVQDWGLDIEVDEANRRLNVEKQKIWDLLRLLRDDLVRSDVTNNKYIATSKRPSIRVRRR